jgi:MFS family permease
LTGPLANPAFRRLWLADLLSSLGSQVSRIALILYLFRETGSVAGIALLVALETLPGALAAPAAGVLVDRVSRRSAMIAADLARAALLLVAAVAPAPSALYLLAALHSVAAAVFQPAQASAVPLAVPAADLPRANGLSQSAASLVMVAGPLIGAELFLTAGLVPTLLADAASFLLSALLVAGARLRPAAGEGAETRPLADLRAGWRYVSGHGTIRQLLLLFFVSLLCVGLWLPLAPFFIRDFLGGSERVLSLQLSAFGAGGALGGLAAPRLVARLGQGGTLLGSLLAEAALMTAYSAVPRVAVSIAILFVWGIVVTVAAVPFYSLVQTLVEERFLGRVFSLLRQSENLALLLAMGIAVALRGRLSSHWILTAAGGVYLAVVTMVWQAPGGRALREIR